MFFTSKSRVPKEHKTRRESSQQLLPKLNNKFSIILRQMISFLGENPNKNGRFNKILTFRDERNVDVPKVHIF